MYSCTPSLSLSLEIAINSAQFRGRLRPDLDFLESAIKLAERVGTSGLDLCTVFEGNPVGHTIQLWVDAGQFEWLSDEVERRVMGSLLNVIRACGVFKHDDMFSIALQSCSNRGDEIQMELLLELPYSVNNVVWNTIEMSRWNRKDEKSVACQLIERMTDDTLNTIDIPDDTSGYQNILKTSIEYNRPYVIAALMKRLPRIEFDLIVLHSPLAEPMRLFLPTDDSSKTLETRELIAAGEHFTQTYYREKVTLVRMVLVDVIIPELIAIVVAYAERIPLSTVKLEPIPDE